MTKSLCRTISTAEDFNNTVKKGNKIVIYVSPTCSICEKLITVYSNDPKIRSFLDEKGIEAICVDTSKRNLFNLAIEKGIMGLPKIQFYGSTGNVSFTQNGFAGSDIFLDMLKIFFDV